MGDKQEEYIVSKCDPTKPIEIPNANSRRNRKLLRHKSLEEAWERKREQFLREELKNMEEGPGTRAVGRSSSDCGRGFRETSNSIRIRTRSLTDDDLEELRGCIDLGFGFGKEEDERLCTTVPALELCYAIARQYQEVNNNATSSPSSPLGSWRISSPGDHPQQVKMRLKHWAQAVACTIRQCC